MDVIEGLVIELESEIAKAPFAISIRQKKSNAAGSPTMLCLKVGK